jgi:hypothetical protein
VRLVGLADAADHAQKEEAAKGKAEDEPYSHAKEIARKAK